MLDYINMPFIKFIEVLFEWVLSFVKSYGLSLMLLSLIVNIILLPFYHIAEQIEKKERDIQAKMKPKIDEFKSVYKGYELHLYTTNVYRLNNYHPAYSLRGLVSLLIQVPFFMGAYSYLSNYSGFNGASFLMFSNLALPDGLVAFGNTSINVLPFLMTGINLITGYIYAKEMSKSEKTTIVIIALFFLVILYNSPSSLLIYWTFNNIFSLVKTVIYSIIENKKRIKETC